jgi:hypothetical protein
MYPVAGLTRHLPFGLTAAPSGFGADGLDSDRAAQDMPEVLEGQGSGPGEHCRGVQAAAADACEVERAEDDGADGTSGDVRCEVAAALNARGQIDNLLVDVHRGFSLSGNQGDGGGQH